MDEGRPLPLRESPLRFDHLDARAPRVRCLDYFYCGEGSCSLQRDRGEERPHRGRPWRARGSPGGSPLQTGWHCFFEGCGDLWISDGSRASGLGRSRASRGGEGIRTPNLPDWQGRSRPLSTSRRRVSRHWRPGSGIRPRHPERSQSSPGSRMNPRTMMTAGRRRYTDHAPAEAVSSVRSPLVRG